MHLLGHARIYALAVRDAMIEALEGGISLHEDSHYKTPIEIDSWEIAEVNGAEMPNACGEARLNFTSPYVFVRGV